MRFVLPALPRHRHPLVRALSLLVGMAVVAVLLVCGLVVAGVLLVGGGLLLALRQWRRARTVARPAPRGGQRPQVLDGEFVVISQGRAR
ncbi:hypothetical protein [Fulvimonas soli]|jgi:hypothetical protein|uniref:Uncharacterized protein n=1 Tax=Fulvimonas soli TaxID=155197 RepID=A0A316HQF1_9GAMM|nr:hypothetical protein [Fulvimonas soli]PWK83496.1 hypothetical protein C7456_11329 [Fulvimonas soli]TNY25524.1 hypothetical protein BV497_13610 [Fulvimonas soli]